MRNFEQPNVGVGLAVIRDGMVLLHKRKGNHAPDTWAFPGGHLELYESFSDCALREMREEAGDDLQIGRVHYWDTLNTIFYDEQKHYIVIFMWADWISGEAIITEPDKNAMWKWWHWTDLPANKMQGLDLLRRYHPRLP